MRGYHIVWFPYVPGDGAARRSGTQIESGTGNLTTSLILMPLSEPTTLATLLLLRAEWTFSTCASQLDAYAGGRVLPVSLL